jgi:K+-sensing histidine kinase KdpD
MDAAARSMIRRAAGAAATSSSSWAIPINRNHGPDQREGPARQLAEAEDLTEQRRGP